MATDFEAFYRANADTVRRALAVTLGDAHVAAEATDEAMTRALARWRRVSGHDSPAGWVYRVGLNWAISRWRRLRRETPLADDGFALPDRDRARADGHAGWRAGGDGGGGGGGAGRGWSERRAYLPSGALGAGTVEPL